MTHANSESFRDFVTKALIAGGGGWTGQYVAALTSDPSEPGEVEAVAYLARDGVEMSPEAL